MMENITVRTLYVFRHSYTKKGEGRGKGSHLSRQGLKPQDVLVK
ncbi:MAG: hypothetical protein AAF512_12690 [Pseudomonadota bacterium]